MVPEMEETCAFMNALSPVQEQEKGRRAAPDAPLMRL
jgi:hypothetical protein